MYVERKVENGFSWRSALQDPFHMEKYLKASKVILILPIEISEAIKVWGEKELST
jgi:hypothetical protein